MAQPPEPLLSQRMAALEAWVSRAASLNKTLLAYGGYSDQEIVTHTVREVGSFGPGILLALEYDSTLFVPGVNGNFSLLLRPKFDPTTLRWIDQDTVEVTYELNVSALYDPVSNEYKAIANGLRFNDTFVFTPSTPLVRLDYGVQDPYGSAVFEADAAAVTPEQFCYLLVNVACTGEKFKLTNFTGYDHCVSYMTDLAKKASKCMHKFKSNTTACRLLHMISAIGLPDFHCPHVRPYDSMVCRDQCLPACDGCSPNAHCLTEFPDRSTTVHKCECNEGYTGDGYNCTANPCATRTDCNDNPNQVVCDAGLCKCRPSFTWISTNTDGDVCQCINGRVFSDGPNGPECIPTGRCLTDDHCRLQKPETVKCTKFEPITQYSPRFNACKCNYGYQGGWEYPCSCAAPKREVSAGKNGKICISATECSEDYHCPRPNGRCSKPDGALIGTCI